MVFHIFTGAPTPPSERKSYRDRQIAVESVWKPVQTTSLAAGVIGLAGVSEAFSRASCAPSTRHASRTARRSLCSPRYSGQVSNNPSQVVEKNLLTIDICLLYTLSMETPMKPDLNQTIKVLLDAYTKDYEAYLARQKQLIASMEANLAKCDELARKAGRQ